MVFPPLNLKTAICQIASPIAVCFPDSHWILCTVVLPDEGVGILRGPREVGPRMLHRGESHHGPGYIEKKRMQQKVLAIERNLRLAARPQHAVTFAEGPQCIRSVVEHT